MLLSGHYLKKSLGAKSLGNCGLRRGIQIQDSFIERRTPITGEINRIRIKGVWIEGEVDVRDSIANSFKDLLSNPGDWRASLKCLQFLSLNVLEEG